MCHALFRAEHDRATSQFTIHDREDSADLMNLMRHDLGFSKTEGRFPAVVPLISGRKYFANKWRACCPV
jgi:hypothetical protein